MRLVEAELMWAFTQNRQMPPRNIRNRAYEGPKVDRQLIEESIVERIFYKIIGTRNQYIRQLQKIQK